MDANHILKLKINPYKLIECLDTILPANQTNLIRQEIHSNVRQLVRLAQSHLRFAKTATGRDAWRQKVSRAYFACYLASRAVRLAVSGHYNTESKDHKNIGELPRATASKFPIFFVDIFHPSLLCVVLF